MIRFTECSWYNPRNSGKFCFWKQHAEHAEFLGIFNVTAEVMHQKHWRYFLPRRSGIYSVCPSVIIIVRTDRTYLFDVVILLLPRRCHRRGGGRSLLVVYFVLPLNYLSEWSPMERRAPAQWFVTRPVSLRSLKTGMTQIPFLLVLYVFIALVYFTTVNLVHKSTHYRVVCNVFVCRALHALGRAAPTLGAPQSLGWAAPRFCWFSWVRRAHWAAA